MKVLLIPLFAAMALGLSSCDPKKMPDVPGLLIISRFEGETSAIYEPSTGFVRRITWPNRFFMPTFKCRGQADTMLITSSCLPDGSDYATGYRRYTYKWVPPDSEPVMIKRLSGTEFWCQSLDYDEEGNQYLYSGSLDGRYGVFLLDSAYSVVDTIAGGHEWDPNRWPAGRSFFLGSGEYVWAFSDSIFLKSAERESPYLCRGDGIADALPFNKGLICWDESDIGVLSAYILTLTGDRRQGLELSDSKCGPFTASPDGRYIAYSRALIEWSGFTYLTIYDIESGDKTYTWVNATCRNNLWIDSLSVDWRH